MASPRTIANRTHRLDSRPGLLQHGGMILLVNSGGAEAVPDWQALFAQAAPDLDVRWIDDPTVDPADVRYVLVYDPPLGRLAALPNLNVILSAAAGVDHITRDPSWPRHLPLVRMGGDETCQRMSEYVCLAALSMLRDMPRIIVQQAARHWDSFDMDRTAPDTRVGIMGLGNLGAHAAGMLRGLGFPVAGWSRSRKGLPGLQCFAGAEERDAFLAQSDILVCLLPDTAGTRGAIRAETLAKLPRGASLINAGRGPQVVVTDVLAALDTGHLSSAMLDVFDPEPLPPDHPVWTHKRVIVTPHTASTASRPARARYVAEAIARFERGDPLPNVFDPARGY